MNKHLLSQRIADLTSRISWRGEVVCGAEAIDPHHEFESEYSDGMTMTTVTDSTHLALNDTEVWPWTTKMYCKRRVPTSEESGAKSHRR